MTTKSVNIVSFNIPYPADYGGVIDVFCKIKAFYDVGVNVILHTFEYGREQSDVLDRYCSEVYYYKRKTGFVSQLTVLPYIVKSRVNDELLKNLMKNDYPILFEGLHTCYYVDKPELKDRIKIVRTHNIEHKYYKALARTTDCLKSRLFFNIELYRLKRYEKVLEHADYIIPLSDSEAKHFKDLYGEEKTTFIPIFHPDEEIDIKQKIDDPYLIFHGTLGVAENVSAAIYLIESIAKKDKSLKLVIAGRTPSKILVDKVSEVENVVLIIDPEAEEMQELIRNASINILYVKYAAGVKLKLLNSLFTGRFCIANQAMTEGSMLEDLCIMMPEDEDVLLDTIHQYYSKEFSDQEIDKRRTRLQSLYDNKKNVLKIVDLFR